MIYPLRYSNIMTPERSVVILAALWIYACVTGAGPFYAGQWVEDETKCTLNSSIPSIYVILAITIQYPLCSCIMIILYTIVFYVAHQQIRRINVTIGALDHSNNALVKDTKTADTRLGTWCLSSLLDTVLLSGYNTSHGVLSRSSVYGLRCDVIDGSCQ